MRTLLLITLLLFSSCATVQKEDNLLDDCNDTLKEIGACLGDKIRITRSKSGKTKNEQQVLSM